MAVELIKGKLLAFPETEINLSLYFTSAPAWFNHLRQRWCENAPPKLYVVILTRELERFVDFSAPEDVVLPEFVALTMTHVYSMRSPFVCIPDKETLAILRRDVSKGDIVLPHVTLQKVLEKFLGAIFFRFLHASR